MARRPSCRLRARKGTVSASLSEEGMRLRSDSISCSASPSLKPRGLSSSVSSCINEAPCPGLSIRIAPVAGVPTTTARLPRRADWRSTLAVTACPLPRASAYGCAISSPSAPEDPSSRPWARK